MDFAHPPKFTKKPSFEMRRPKAPGSKPLGFGRYSRLEVNADSIVFL